jgi:16S rRNA U516 pseudouridylate synthase RsuA-like enzyme
MRGPLNDQLVGEFRAATDCDGEAMSILEARAKYGEGFNHWLNVTVRATRSALVRHWFGARGIIVSRLMRTRFGPVHLAPDLPRGHSRAMTPPERNALLNEISAAAHLKGGVTWAGSPVASLPVACAIHGPGPRIAPTRRGLPRTTGI